jgi:hypothetical protein
MVNPPALALRRRADELQAAATRELPHDPDAAALLLFYATECGLKSLYMIQNNLKDTADARGRALPARTFVHDILSLLHVLPIPRSAYAPNPELRLSRTGEVIHINELHQAWRYGERVTQTDVIFAWLLRVCDLVRRNR